MKSLLTALAITTALTLPGVAMARPVTLTTTLTNYGGDGAYVVFYVSDAEGSLCWQLGDGRQQVASISHIWRDWDR